MKGRRRTTIFRPGLMSNLIIYYKLINYKCMDNIMKCTPLGEQKSLWLRKTLLIMKFFVLFLLLGTVPCWAGIAYSQNVKMSLDMENTTVHDVINEQVIEMVREGRVEMGIAFEPSPNHNLLFTPLAVDRFVAIVPQQSPLAKKKQLTWLR